MEKDSFFNNWCWENWTATCKRIKLEHSLIPYTKINSKWITEINVRPDTTKLLDENIGRTLSDINCNKLFNPPPRAMKIHKTQTNVTQLSLKTFTQQKIKINKDNLQNGGKYLQMK